MQNTLMQKSEILKRFGLKVVIVRLLKKLKDNNYEVKPLDDYIFFGIANLFISK